MMRNAFVPALALVLTLAALGVSPVASAQLPRAEVTLDDGAASAKVPFTSHRRWMVLQVSVAGSAPLQFILDSGAPVVVLASQKLGESLPLQIIGQAQINGAGDGDGRKVALAGNVTVKIEGATITSASMAVGAGGEAIAGMDGIFGGTLFRDLVVDIDWDSSTLTLHDPERFEYTGDGIILPLTLLPSGHLLVDGTVTHGGVARAARLLVDTGAGHALSLEPALLSPADSLSDLIIGWGANGVARGDIAAIDSLQLADITLHDVITSFPSGAPWTGMGTAQHAVIHGNLGQRILRRFHVIFDVPGERLILEPGPTLNTPFAFDTTGLALTPTTPGSDEVEIAEVIPGSPAAEAGIAAGDRLLAIDGRGMADIDPLDVESLLWGPPGGQVEVDVMRNGERRQHRLTRRALLR